MQDSLNQSPASMPFSSRGTISVAVWAILVVLTIASASALAGSFVYLSVAGEKRIAVYARNPRTGELTHRSDVELNGEPGALTAGRENRLLLASMRSTGNLASFSVDPESGRLELLSEVPAGADPAYVALDNSGQYLLSAYYRAAKVMVHRVRADGRIATPPVQELPTADKAHAILTDRSNRFVFVPHTGPNVIFQFTFDATTGTLHAADPGPYPAARQHWPPSPVISPDCRFRLCQRRARKQHYRLPARSRSWPTGADSGRVDATCVRLLNVIQPRISRYTPRAALSMSPIEATTVWQFFRSTPVPAGSPHEGRPRRSQPRARFTVRQTVHISMLPANPAESWPCSRSLRSQVASIASRPMKSATVRGGCSYSRRVLREGRDAPLYRFNTLWKVVLRLVDESTDWIHQHLIRFIGTQHPAECSR